MTRAAHHTFSIFSLQVPGSEHGKRVSAGQGLGAEDREPEARRQSAVDNIGHERRGLRGGRGPRPGGHASGHRVGEQNLKKKSFRAIIYLSYVITCGGSEAPELSSGDDTTRALVQKEGRLSSEK